MSPGGPTAAPGSGVQASDAVPKSVTEKPTALMMRGRATSSLTTGRSANSLRRKSAEARKQPSAQHTQANAAASTAPAVACFRKKLLCGGAGGGRTSEMAGMRKTDRP